MCDLLVKNMSTRFKKIRKNVDRKEKKKEHRETKKKLQKE